MFFLEAQAAMTRMPGPADNVSPDYVAGMALYAQGSYAEAIDLLEQAATGGGAIGPVARYYVGMAHRALGLAALQAGHDAASEQHLRAAIAALGARPSLVKSLAFVCARTGQLEACARELDRPSGDALGGPDAQSRLAMARWQAGQREEAMLMLGAAARQSPGEASAHLRAGLCHAAAERYPEARACLERAIECECDNAKAHRYLGLALTAMGDFLGAARAFQRTLDLQNDNLTAAYHLALSARAAGEQGCRLLLHLPEGGHEEAASAMDHLARYVAGEPRFLEAIISLPPDEVDADMFAMLRDVIAVALGRHADYADLRLLHSRVLARLDHLAEALEEVGKALKMNARHLQALMHLADLQEQLGATAEAAETLRRAIEAGADWPDVHHHLSKLDLKLGRSDLAQRHVDRALTLNANYTAAIETQKRLAA